MKKNLFMLYIILIRNKTVYGQSIYHLSVIIVNSIIFPWLLKAVNIKNLKKIISKDKKASELLPVIRYAKTELSY